ncbi:MAG: methylenetetrahydrofolate reductase [Clostridia bacterium]|nr:methylenetetrahydrofolate reductase [NAD(P)H] [Clostridia bacterium]
MKIAQKLGHTGYSISFEVFPPKEDTRAEQVFASAMEIASLNPSFISVTYGAGGGTSRFTMQMARDIQEKTGVSTMAHLTCISSTRATVDARIDELLSCGIDNVMALRGDRPQGQENPADQDFAHATDLIAHLREKAGDRIAIGGACYPEVHPESTGMREDLLHLKEKVEAGCDFLTTQMFFDNALFYRFLYRLRESGVTVPVIPGIMPITNARQIDRARKLSGSFMPQRFLSLVDTFGNNNAAMEQAGIIYATDQIIDLFANDIRHVHVYTMNHPHVARAILENLSGILGTGA